MRRRGATAHCGRLNRRSNHQITRLRGVDVSHRQAHASLAIDFEHLHAHHVAFLELVADALDALLGDLRDMHQTVAARQDGHERAEVHQPRDLAFIYPAHFDVGGDQLDAPLRFTPRGTLHRSDLDRAVVLDVDGRARLFGDLPDHGAALADHVADLLRVDLQGDDGGRPLRHGLARLGEHFVHLAQDVQAAIARLIQRHLHDLARDARDLDVHLQRGDAVLRPGHFEIHVAQMIFIAEDVRQNLEPGTLLHETHRHAGHGRLDRHTRVHQREAGAAHGGHRARAVRFENLRYHADDVREFLHARHHRLDAALGQVAVTDLAPFRRAHHAGFADAERREIVVQHERLFLLAHQAVDDLRIPPGSQRRHDQSLSLATGKQRRTVSSREYAGADIDGAHRLGVAAVDARLTIENFAAHQSIFQIGKLGAHLFGSEFRCLALG